ncbi:ketopantoate reductase family protein [Pseudarthrobacter albicanus]|uniref:ketopantoate reductase family protein n=1 Tax=Pseudarthrobacter albicanus TaxID=2823873 RepID=UPI001BA6DDA8|nr:2-dehydropantoate 2-reductase [Pseudarthrobacter albicanus]
MKIGILGAGAMGQLFGGRLQMAGNDVVFIDAAPSTIEALNAQGITVRSEGQESHTPVRAGTASDFNETLELIIVFTKSFHTEAAVASVGHLISTRTFGLTLQNGLGNADALARSFGPEHTLVGITDFPADLERPGLITTGPGGKVRVGTFTDGSRAFLRLLVDKLNEAGLNASAEDDIQTHIWEKLAFNAALNTLSAVTGQTVGQIGASGPAKELVARVVDETVLVADSQDVRVSRDRIEAALRNAYKHAGEHKTSMLQDREAGRRTEADYIGGAIVRLGEIAGVRAPLLGTLTTLASEPIQ